MTYRKKTLRRMSPTARKVARLAGEAESVARRLKNLIPDLQRLDLDSQALAHAKGGKLDTKVKCFKCGWEGTYKDCIFGHDDYVCPVCSVESLEEK